MENYEITRATQAGRADLDIIEIKTDIKYLRSKMDEHCTNLTKLIERQQADKDAVNARFSEIEKVLLNFVPRTAFDERLELVIRSCASSQDVAASKLYSKAAIAGEFALLIIFVAAWLHQFT
jgi:hypothetical protein